MKTPPNVDFSMSSIDVKCVGTVTKQTNEFNKTIVEKQG